ncbi:MAG: ATP-binding cassette subfamily C protein CydC [Motiliproteus sp.]|jgi:ATP-binding cassette subfamily C protein CydC
MPTLVKRYFCLLWEQRGLAVLGLLLATLTAISGIALLAVSGWFISATALAGLSVAGAHSFNYFAPGAIVRGLSITRTLGRYGERLSTHEATLRVISQLRAELFGELAKHSWQEQPLNNHDVSSRLMEDIKHAEALYLSALVPGFVMLLCSLLYLITMSLFMPAIWVWLVPILLVSVVLMPWLYMHQVLQPQDRLNQQRSQQWSNASSVFSNVRTLILYQRFEQSTLLHQQAASAADDSEQQASHARQRVLLASQLVFAVQIVVVLWQGLTALSQGQLEGAHLFMLLLLTLGVQEVMSGGINALANFGLGVTALQRIDRQTATIRQKDQRRFIPAAASAIKLAGLSYHYPQREVLIIDRLNAELKAPHWYWITAPSGHGKTTFLQLLMGRLQPGEGVISIGKTTAGQLGLMPQEIELLRGTLRYNLCLHLPHSDEYLEETLRLVELQQWCEQLPQGLDTWLGKGERMLSGGELKRLGLARLILQDAQMLLLDEPTAGIDQPRAARILDRLHRHWNGKLVIINSHDASLRSRTDRVLSL